MGQTQKIIRIFISSPGDVTEERDAARRVIEALQRQYAGATLQPVLWEDLALPATASFQESIDFLLERKPIDVAVFIVWSRLGSPLEASIARPHGAPYRSGTERELDLMLTAFEKSGRRRPIILAYARDDDVAFKQKLTESATSELEDLVTQRKLVDAFIREQFYDSEGHNVRALQSYHDPVGFAQRLRVHLRDAIDSLVGLEAAPSWLEEPYRGLDVFEVEHSPIFHGRDEETCDLLQRLRDQEKAGCAFVVIVGASGSGKSSLARAGVAASLVRHIGDESIRTWRTAFMVPSLAASRLSLSLARTLVSAIPEIGNAGIDCENIDVALVKNPAIAVKRAITPALARASKEAGGPVRLLLVIDQMEELWTDRRITPNDQKQFLRAIEAIARSGYVSVLATLRSDFFQQAQRMPIFIRLRGACGHFDLLPPGPVALGRLITEPARLAGMRFEHDDSSGRSLDQVILQDAVEDLDALPLLEYTLAELYDRRDKSRRLLTFAAYNELGGVEGALGKRANAIFLGLPVEAQQALQEVLPLLVTVDVTDQQAAVRRRATVADLSSTPARKTLTDCLTTARFLTMDRQGDTPIASLAHEALLRRWDRIVTWINTNRERLRLRARVEQSQQRWNQQDRDQSLLLAPGLPLDEGLRLLRESPYLLTETTTEYIRSSVEHHAKQVTQSRRRRWGVVSAFAVLLTVMIVAGIAMREARIRDKIAMRKASDQERIAMRQASIREKRNAEAIRLVRGLLQADTSQLAAILDDLADYRDLARDDLTTAFAESADDSKVKLHAALALLDEDESVLPFLKERLLVVSPAEFATILALLEAHKDELIEDYQKIAMDSREDDRRRFQAACVLANYDSESEVWGDNQFCEFVANHLTGVFPSELLVWRNALRPAKEQLAGPLALIYHNRDVGEQVRAFATDTLADYFSDDADYMFNLLADADQRQFPLVFETLIRHQERAIKLATDEVTKSSLEGDDEIDEEASAVRKANAAVLLLTLGAADQVWPLMRHSHDPRVRSHVIHRLSTLGGEARTIIARYEQETDVTVKRALLLCLGEFDDMRLPEQDRKRLMGTITDVYRSHPDAGLHGAARWLLRRWGQSDRIAAIDKELQQVEERRVTNQENSRQWYINGQGQTFVILHADEFQMGSTESEAGRHFEDLHRRQIGRRFAISATEVTRAQWRVFDATVDAWSADQQHLDLYMRTDDSPMIAMTWYEAAWYCNWLSEQEGIPESQWCYQPNNESVYGPGMKTKDRFWELTGYRLPTEAEWEFACRAGSTSSRYYGHSETLLSKYAWYLANSEAHVWPVASLKPNDFGLFDMHGNVYEWCFDGFFAYPGESNEVIDDKPGTGTVSETRPRVLRGGSFDSLLFFHRSASRVDYQPGSRDVNYGFRPCRTLE